jgi:hypothetical protein
MRSTSFAAALAEALLLGSALTRTRAADMTQERALNPQRDCHGKSAAAEASQHG